MDWTSEALQHLSAADAWGYHARSSSASEPAALSALALLAHGRDGAARGCLDWLHKVQADDGCVGVDALQQQPGWPTGWAVQAWQAATRSSAHNDRDADAAERGVQWLLQAEGAYIPRGKGLGHDTTLIGWPWVDGTHSWLEPTAINLLALKHTGHGEHPRAREAVRLLVDRLLEHGGCNYGNTIVFGQELRPHLQPTGACLMALAGEHLTDRRVGRSIDFLRRELSSSAGTSSLCFGLMGLHAWGAAPAEASEWLASVAQRTLRRDPASYRLALLTLTALADKNPLIPPGVQPPHLRTSSRRVS
jgi:hypothetical protein